MTCTVPGCSGAHSRSAHHQQRQRTGKVWPVGPVGGKRRTPGEKLVDLYGTALRVSARCREAIMREAVQSKRTLYAIARSILERWATRTPRDS